MGLDLREMPPASLPGLADRLRTAGFDVRVTHEPSRVQVVYLTTHYWCRRGQDVQHLYWHDYPGDPPRVYISNAWHWWPPTRKRREQLQADVTSVLEQAGGRFPLPRKEPTGTHEE
jgi:hypothetical protein